MPISSIKSVQFTAQLFDDKGLALNRYLTAIQYFDIKSNTWVLLASNISALAGKVTVSVNLNTRLKENLRFFEQIATGSTPICRLISNSSLKLKVTEIVSESLKLSYNDRDSVLVVSFGNNYQIPQEQINSTQIDKTDNTLIIFSNILSGSNTAELNKMKLDIEAKTSQLNKLNLLNESNIKKQSDLETQLGKTQTQLSQLSAQLKDSQSSNQQTEKILKEQQIKISSFEKENKLLQGQIEKLSTSNTANSQLVKENKELNTTISKLNLDLKSNTDSLTKTISEKEALQKDLTKTKAEVARINVEFSTLENVIVANTKALNEAQKKFQEANALAEKLKTENLSQSKIIEKLNDTIAAAGNTTDKIEYKPSAQPVSKVYSSIIEEFQKTNELTKDSKFKLSNISLNIKTFIEHDKDGIRMQLVDASKLKDINPAALSDFNIDIKDSSTGSATDGLKVPDLLGLTETAARRITDSLGLRLKAIYQYVNANIPVGQSFKQSPAKTENIGSNDSITLIFAKENN